METNDLCAQCACLPVCGIYRVVGPMERCHFHCRKKRSARWVKAECSEKNGNAWCSACGCWEWDSCNYCPDCGAEMGLEEG